MIKHLALPIEVPDLSGLTLAELTTLRNGTNNQIKEARSRASKLIGKEPALSALNLSTLRRIDDEETKEAAYEAFHQELLRHPLEFLAYTHTNSLHILDKAIWKEMLARSEKSCLSP